MDQLLDAVRTLVDGRTVAVVGNSPAVLRYPYGDQIDAADVVVRFNYAIPSTDDHARAIGRRTDLWATARYDGPDHVPFGTKLPWPKLILWMKLTELGRKQRVPFSNLVGHHAPILDYPQEREDFLRALLNCGKGPSTGMRVLDLLQNCSPAKVDVYGFGWFGMSDKYGPAHWYDFSVEPKPGRGPFHDGEAEYPWFRSLGRYHERGPSWQSTEAPG